MISLGAAVAILVSAYFGSYVYCLLRNLYYARQANMPYVIIPFDQNAFAWMVLSVPLRPKLKKILPAWVWDRVAITIYGWEFHEGFKPFERWAKPAGNERTMAWVTCGSFEFNSWDSEVALEILKRPKDFQEPHFNALFMGRFGQNVLTTNGEHWARQRKIIAQVVNEKISKLVWNETMVQTKGLLDEVLEHGKHDSAETYGVFDMMKKITIHVLSGAGMGKNVPWENVQEKPGAGYRMTYMEACKVVVDAVAGPIILPAWFLDNYPKSFPGARYIQSMAVAVREFPLHTRDMLNAERQRMEADVGQTHSNITSQLLHAAEGGKSGKGLSEEEMVGNLFIFTAAGFDTTANTLSYALAVLARYPKWQAWMCEEVDDIMPKGQVEELDYATIYPQANRVMAVMLETLRLFSPVIHIPKATYGTQIIQTSKGTYRIPSGSTCYVDSINLHRDPEVWRDVNLGESDVDDDSDKPDEMIFRPSRWINPPGSSQPLFQPPKGSFVPWSFGPRNCPGMKMAQVEFTAVFLALFRKHKIEAVALQIPDQAEPGLSTRSETQRETFDRLDSRIADSVSILTLQMEGVYGADKPGIEQTGLKMRICTR